MPSQDSPNSRMLLPHAGRVGFIPRIVEYCEEFAVPPTNSNALVVEKLVLFIVADAGVIAVEVERYCELLMMVAVARVESRMMRNRYCSVLDTGGLFMFHLDELFLVWAIPQFEECFEFFGEGC